MRALTFGVPDAVDTSKALEYEGPTWHAYPRPCGRHLMAPGDSESKDKALGMPTHRFLEDRTQSVPLVESSLLEEKVLTILPLLPSISS